MNIVQDLSLDTKNEIYSKILIADNIYKDSLVKFVEKKGIITKTILKQNWTL